MTRSPREIRLREILEPFEPILGPSRPCPFGNKECSDADPCAGHEHWKHVKDVYAEFLSNTTIHDVSVRNGARTVSKGRKRR